MAKIIQWAALEARQKMDWIGPALLLAFYAGAGRVVYLLYTGKAWE